MAPKDDYDRLWEMHQELQEQFKELQEQNKRNETYLSRLNPNNKKKLPKKKTKGATYAAEAGGYTGVAQMLHEALYFIIDAAGFSALMAAFLHLPLFDWAIMSFFSVIVAAIYRWVKYK